LLLTACLGIPENVKPVENFKSEKYLEKWYEIARLDHPFEQALTRVTANYTLRDDADRLKLSYKIDIILPL
jgi:apolipoprotein D and lipocalin family protein